MRLAVEMKLELTAILGRLRADYVEINIQKTNAKAWADYIEFERNVARKFKSPKVTGTKRKKSGKRLTSN